MTCHDEEHFGKTGKITFDWKHLIFEDYDEWLWGNRGPFLADSRSPDYVIISVGMHSCLHYHEHLTDTNDNGSQKHEDLVQKELALLMTALSEYIERLRGYGRKSEIIFMTTGRLHNHESDEIAQFQLDKCILKFNRFVSTLAHRQGFVIFEREEVERRLLSKSSHLMGQLGISLPKPAPEIVATSLLAMIACLQKGRLRNKGVLNARHQWAGDPYSCPRHPS